MRLKDTEQYVVAKERDLFKLSPAPDTVLKKMKKVKKKVKRGESITDYLNLLQVR